MHVQQSAKGLSEGEYRSESVFINTYALGQLHHCLHCSEIAQPIKVKYDSNSSKTFNHCNDDRNKY